eukprot:TRINITY_DN5153_c0_g1_i2.p1 TRINITY_DN5153_c0_g1~~TRINITY_DN5153_c0_g1_i2.p1  ORF type:complete len:334 (-),score=58.15 TRINITY_DN5153_c0_g1_i2:21-884(-)
MEKAFDGERAARDAMKGTTDVSLPIRVSAAALLAGDENQRRNLIQSLKKHGYAIIQMDDQTTLAAKNLENIAWKYFAQPDDVKDRNSGADRSNLGYIRVKGTREFIKLRPSDETRLWPNKEALPDFEQIYRDFYQRMFTLVWSAFRTLADSPGTGNSPLLNQNQIAAIEDFVREKSSVSMIHYYPQAEKESCVCEEHKDTGLLTAVFKTGVPSLQMWDKASEKYVKIEELANDSELILFMGEKIPLFAQQEKSLPESQRFLGTPHRVIVPEATVDRLSMAFLLDVAK